jgi:hypothetical protein
VQGQADMRIKQAMQGFSFLRQVIAWHRGQSTILDKVRLSKGEFEWLGDGRKNDSAGEFNAQCGPGHGVEAEEERGKLSRIVD